WVEPGEPIEDQRLIIVPASENAILRIQLRVVYKRLIFKNIESKISTIVEKTVAEKSSILPAQTNGGIKPMPEKVPSGDSVRLTKQSRHEDHRETRQIEQKKLEQKKSEAQQTKVRR